MDEEQELTPAQQAKLDKLRGDWDQAKIDRDKACEAAWALPDVEARRPAYDQAKADWEKAKQQLLEREATIRAG